MHSLRLLSPVLFLCVALCAKADNPDRLQAVKALVDAGQYRHTKVQIEKLLQIAEAPTLRRQLAFEAERMRRIERDFPQDYAALKASIRRYIPDAREEEIRDWDRAEWLEFKQIDGERRYFRMAAYNLLQLSDQLAQRSADFRGFTEKAPLYSLHPHHREVINGKTPLRNRIQVDYTLRVKPDAVPAGETVRAWLPFPIPLPGSQENIELLASSPGRYQLAPPLQPQRTIYLEKTARAGEATEFKIRYAFDSLSRHTVVDQRRVQQLSKDGQLAPYLAERPPHIVFTPELRALSQRVVGGESNSYRIAQKLFAHVDKIPWASAREYSTIRNISHYAAHAGHADCGQQTLLLITLMRMNGIPARWQSGWEFSPGDFDTMHDWGEFYLEPYGWLPMDVTHGVLAGETEAETWFYLGGLDAFRLVFNSDYSQPFFPEKEHFRSETVDSQRGEVEWRGGNLYFDQWNYDLEWQLVKPEN
ncbi:MULTISPECIES: transglutaminase domain-containing protein [unclassified Microbulbifer]|uniref:transglutaminase-like domain-containing protein n=1 Tax=unclassified Microbulbifer TaxID=2619833 RepID=UPI0027E4D8B7|nr:MULTISPECIES: transglutaminase domain-containing protein [unclassified Microbulbifer]